MGKTIKITDRFAIKTFLDFYQKKAKDTPDYMKYEVDYVLDALNEICNNDKKPDEAFTRKIPYKELKKRYFFFALYVKYVAKWIRANTNAVNRPKGEKPTDIAKQIIKIYTGEDLEVISKAYKEFGKKVDSYPQELAPNVKPIIKMMKKNKKYDWM